MPRTKINRKVLANKRTRRSSTDERIEAKLKEFDALVYEFQTEVDEDYRSAVEKVTEMTATLKQQTSKKVLAMTIGEVRRVVGKTLNELTMTVSVASHNSHPSDHITDVSTLGSLSLVGDKIGEKKKAGHPDEGYLTETTSPSRSSGGRSSIKSNTSTKSGRLLGPLASSKAQRARRSQSAGASVLNSVSSKPMRATPLQATVSAHMSRPKYRTPMEASRQKAVSADRLIITPKVQPNTPMAILRRANIGETAYSVNGSPVITSAAIEEVANVNIPVRNGVLSIRPTEMSSVDPRILTKIDDQTITHLLQLQSNLDMLMNAAGYPSRPK